MRVLKITLVMALAIARPAFAQDLPAPPCTSTVDGHVVDEQTHEPIEGATVTSGSEIVITDAKGRFALVAQCPGAVVITAEREDHKTATQSLALAQAAAVELQLAELDSETIEIHGKPPDPEDTRSVTSISGVALEKTRGKGLSEAIADVPGVAQLKSTSGVGKPIIRGQYGRRLLLLVDGIRHRAQEWGLDHAPEIDPFTADKLTVVRGASGVRYGPDAIGGAVLIDPPELLQEPGYAGEVHLIGISNGKGGALAARFQQAPAVVPGLAYQVDGSYRRLTGARTPDYALDNTGVEEWNAGARAGYRHGRANYELAYSHYQARIGVCSCLRVESRDDFYAQIEQDRPTGSELYEQQFAIDRPRQGVAHDLALARGTWELPLGTLSATYAFQWDHRKEYDVVRQAVTGPQYDFRLQTHELDVSFAHEPIHLDEHWHLRGQVGVVGVGQIHDYAGLPLVPSHESIGGGVYAIERLIGHELELEAGVRYDALARTAKIDRNDYLRLVRSGQLAMDACSGGEEDPVDCASTFHTVSASIGGLYRFTDEWNAKLDFSTASRPPNPDEQFLNGTSPTFPVYGLGKPDLGPETTYSASLTTTLSHANITAEASAYANVIDDYIYFAPALDASGQPIFDVLIRGTFPRFVTRPIDALFLGADGGLAWKPIAPLELGAQLSYVRATDRTNDGYLVFVPPLHARGSITYKPPAFGGFTDAFISVNGSYVGQQSRYDLASDFAAPPDPYFLLGADVGATTKVGAQTVKLALSGQNLTNARYRDYTSLLRYFADQPGWQLVLRATLQFSGH